MKTFDEFLTWAAEQHYTDWINDYEFNTSTVAWGQFRPGVVGTAAAIYGYTPYDVNQAIGVRLAELYGNPLLGENGARQQSGAVSEW